MPNSPLQDKQSNGGQVTDRLKRMTTRSTCAKFLIRIIPPLLVISLIFMAIFGYSMQQNMRAEIDREARVFANALTHVVDDLLWTFQKDELSSALSTLASNPAIIGAAIYDANDKVYVTYGRTPPDDNAKHFSIATPITRQMDDGTTKRLGRLELYYNYAYSDQQFLEHFKGQVMRLFIILSVIIISAYFAYQLVIGRPLRILLKAIRETDAQGIPVKADWDGNDEIGEIIHAHNRMIHNLAEKEIALGESEQRYRQLFDNAMVGIFTIRQDGTLKNANMTMADIMGYPSAEDMMTSNVARHYLDAKDRLTLWERLLDKGRITDHKVRFRRTDNELIWVKVSGRLMTDGSFNGILQDVTAQVEAQLVMKERDELHRAFFEENKAVMLLHDPLDSSIQFVNPAACVYYGYTEEELTSMTVRDLDCMTDDEVFDELKNAATERRGYFKHIHTLKNGSRRNVEVFTGPVSIGSRQLHYSIVHDVTEKRRLEAKLERMATRDQLTGAYNRHAFFEKGKDEIFRARRFEHPMSLLMFDLDHFKKINDAHGHAVGDEVLRVFALRCRAGLRQTDIFARLGGEEFAALLVETDEDLAMEVAERIREVAATKPILSEAGELTVTTSVGVASLKEEETVVQILQRADKALYEAKSSGRNAVRKT